MIAMHSPLSQHQEQASRNESTRYFQQMPKLDDLQRIAETSANNHAVTVGKLDSITSVVGSIQNSQVHQQSNTIFESASTELLARVIRAEMRRSVMSIVEDHLNPYKSSQDAQLKGIKTNLEQLSLALGRLSSTAPTSGSPKNPSKNVDASTTTDGVNVRPAFGEHPSAYPDTSSFEEAGMAYRGSDLGVYWTELWTHTWTFRWPVGVLTVTMMSGYLKSLSSRTVCQAYGACTPAPKYYTYHVSLDFRLSGPFLTNRAFSITCGSRRDQQGFYLISPNISTYAVIPWDAEVFSMIVDQNVEGLRVLFSTGLAAPTDRDPNGLSLLHVGEFSPKLLVWLLNTHTQIAAFFGHDIVCQLLIANGADPDARER